jgi:hypothetical protein
MNEIVDQEAITIKDMVISPDPEIPSGGFSVNSIMMKGGSSSNVFDNLVVPNWAWSLQMNNQTEEEKTIGGRPKYHDEIMNNEDEKDDIVDDDLYNTLLELATENMKPNKSNKTNKTNKKNKATTKKRKRKHENENRKSTNKQTKKNKNKK